MFSFYGLISFRSVLVPVIIVLSPSAPAPNSVGWCRFGPPHQRVFVWICAGGFRRGEVVPTGSSFFSVPEVVVLGELVNLYVIDKVQSGPDGSLRTRE